MSPRIGVVAVGRPTFDVPFAEATTSAAFAALDALDAEIVGHRTLLLDNDEVSAAAVRLGALELDALVVIQATFTDSTMVEPLAASTDAPLVLWGFPEDRTGGRLRLNSLCGINLAAYALALSRRTFRYVYGPADTKSARRVEDALTGKPRGARVSSPRAREEFDAATVAEAERIHGLLATTTIGVIGDHPTGFAPCAYEPARLATLGGVRADPISLPELFDPARAIENARTSALRQKVAGDLAGLDDVEQEPLEDALRLHLAFQDLVDARSWSGVATKCWPECFTEYGSAACAAQAMLSERGVPGCCEADVYGNLTSLVLQWLTGQPAFVADLVEIDEASDTAVMWHCGIAPLALAHPGAIARAAIHSNRAKPLLHEFPLKPGRVTIARFSQSGGDHRLTIGGGEVLDTPMSFSGTSGVVRFDSAAGAVLDTVMSEGLEHHYGIGYGDVDAELRALAELLELPVVELT
ncbi:MAG: fucose isomerase [Acidimicrobiia bacterium]